MSKQHLHDSQLDYLLIKCGYKLKKKSGMTKHRKEAIWWYPEVGQSSFETELMEIFGFILKTEQQIRNVQHIEIAWLKKIRHSFKRSQVFIINKYNDTRTSQNLTLNFRGSFPSLFHFFLYIWLKKRRINCGLKLWCS